MKKALIALPIMYMLLLGNGSVSLSEPNIFYVRPGGSGDGVSWKKASNDLQNVLKKAQSGDQIWVAEGIYFPTKSVDRNVAFELPDGVALFGGFAGKERSVAERKLAERPTILCGNIGRSGSEDNSFNVVRIEGASKQTILDGFIVTGGNANGFEKGASDPARSGGGLYNDGTRRPSAPTVRHCAFIDNFALDGGAVFNNGQDGGNANPCFEDCQFVGNKADLDGGAVMSTGQSQGQAEPCFLRCAFEQNVGNYGGAVFLFPSEKQQSVGFFEDCTFSKNRAYVRGGALFFIERSISMVKDDDDFGTFEGNKAHYPESADWSSMVLN